MRVGLGVASGSLAAAVLLAGCGSPLASTAPPVPSALASPEATTQPITPGATLPLAPGAAVSLDPGLLALLPAAVGGARVSQEAESFAEAVKDPAFVASIDRAVFAIAVSGGDLASGVLAHVRSGIYSDRMFEDWRSSYDEGACAQSNGVVAHAEQTLAGRTTYVTTCGGGLRVYHTYLAAKGVIVSLFSTGTQDFGAQLMDGIQG